MSGVAAAGRHSQHSTHAHDRELTPLVDDELESHGPRCEKMATVLFLECPTPGAGSYSLAPVSAPVLGPASATAAGEGVYTFLNEPVPARQAARADA